MEQSNLAKRIFIIYIPEAISEGDCRLLTLMLSFIDPDINLKTLNVVVGMNATGSRI
jgi:hypothetical protein